MKSPIAYISLFVFIVTIISCSKKSETTEHTDSDEWPEMESFHMIMAEAFHPYKDSTNTGPAKQLAEEMASEAAKWQAAPIPEKVNNENVKGLLEKLKADTRAFADEVSTGITEEQIGISLTGLHDNFHALMEAWHGGGKEKH